MKRAPPQSPAPLLALLEDLGRAVELFRPLGPAPQESVRGSALLHLRTKIIPELERDLALPIFVGVQGGTNTGKSTVFNALCGKLLSPSLVLASATKHPLAFLHQSWRETFLSSSVFPGIEARELSDPKELIVDAEREDLFYFRFHDDPKLLSVAIIDSPDFDSALTSNAVQAERIAAISDITLFVTTAQKYKDLVLVERLRKLLGLKAEVIVIFNMIDEEIVFETILDDLGQALPARGGRLRAIPIATSKAKHPEEEIRASVAARITEPLSLLKAAEVKPAMLSRTVSSLLEIIEEFRATYSSESSFKAEVEALLGTRSTEAIQRYVSESHLSFPEETLAIQKILGLTELGRRLELRRDVERTSKALGFVGFALRRFNDTLRRVLVRLSASDEGSVESHPAALAEYAAARNRADGDGVVRALESARVSVESFVRGREEVSAMARELMRAHFTPQFATGFAARVREAHADMVRATGETGEEIIPRVEGWIASHRLGGRLLTFGAISFKLLIGFLLAWALPPAQGALAIVNPVKWLYFAGGYFLAAYAVALLVCLRMRRRPKLIKARKEAMEKTLRAILIDPLRAAMDEIVTDEKLEALQTIAREIAAHPDLAVMGRDQSHPSRGDGNGTRA